jgi:hypothetical protein
MYYLVVNGEVVSNSAGEPREFPKPKKARHFIEGRAYLGEEYEITDTIDHISKRRRVDF